MSHAERMASGQGEDRREMLARLLRSRASASADHPLSFNQRSLWFTYCLAPDSAAYNVPFAWRVHGVLDVEALRHSFQALVARHTILRTTYSIREPVQRVHDSQEIDFREVDAAAWPDERVQAELIQEVHWPFDLQRGPVLRVRVFRRGPREHLLLVTFHHIAYDLWSMATFLNDLVAFYAAAKAGTPPGLPELRYQYSDFVRWQADMLARDGERLWRYWRERLAGDLPVLTLPTDRPRPPMQTFRGATYSRPLPPDLVSAAHALARAEDTTLFTVLLAAFQVLLHQCSGQQDFLVGSPILGRSRPEFENLIGYFLNTLPLRADLSGTPQFRTFLRATHAGVRGALEHQDYPIELLVERLKPVRRANQPPLFQTMFVLNRARALETPADESGLAFETVPLVAESSQFDLSLEVDQGDETLTTRWEYNTDLFEEETIAGWARQFEEILGRAGADPGRRIWELTASRAAGPFVEPETIIEQMVAGVFQEVLGAERVGLHDDFFDLGGTSLQAARIASGVNELVGTDVTDLRALFEAPTVQRLARSVEDRLLRDLE